jgi:plasmid maintenance system antidote protein VapI
VIDFEDAGLRQALAARDIGTVFRLVVAAGVSQRQLAELVRISQPEVCEIIKGRRVLAYDVLVRVAEGC